MKIFFGLVFLIIFSFSSFSQKNNEVGFKCYYGASSSENVKMMESFLYQMNFDTIRNNLNSIEPSMQFLSSIIIKRLDKEGLIKLTRIEKEEILKISLSKSYIHICSGCTYSDYIKIVDIYNQKDKMKIKQEAINWIDSVLEKIN